MDFSADAAKIIGEAAIAQGAQRLVNKVIDKLSGSQSQDQNIGVGEKEKIKNEILREINEQNRIKRIIREI